MSSTSGNGNGHRFDPDYLANGNGNGNGKPAAGADLKEKAPPQALEAERSVLGSLMCDGSKFEEVADRLEPDHFYRDTHQQLAHVIWHLAHQGTGFDAVMVADELERRNLLRGVGGLEFLRELCDAAMVANCVYHAQVVKQCAVARSTYQIAGEMQRSVHERILTPQQNLERSISHLAALFADDDDDGEGLTIRDFPAQPGPAAFHGVIGDLVNELDPYTEASLAAMIFQLLVGFGSMVGRGPHWVHEADRHRLNMYLCLVGNTADGRKGTSWGYPRRILTEVDPTWSHRIIPGINSGPAMIEQVADEETSRTGQLFRGQPDKRLLMYESEFTRLLAIFARDSETLGMVLRQAWETEDLAALSKKNALRATGAHVSVVAHVTPEDLQSHLSLTDIANGLGNRFLWVCARASKRLEGEVRFDWARVAPLIDELRLSLEFGTRDIGLDSVPMGRSPAAQAYWREALEGLRKRRPGLLGAILARGPAQVMRLAATYAVIDRVRSINVEHLKAALELWSYCVRSIDFIFGDRLGDPDAERLIKVLEEAGEDGLSQREIHRRLFRNKDSETLNVLLRRMIRGGFIRRVPKRTGARGPQSWMWLLDAPPLPKTVDSRTSFSETEATPY